MHIRGISWGKGIGLGRRDSLKVTLGKVTALLLLVCFNQKPIYALVEQAKSASGGGLRGKNTKYRNRRATSFNPAKYGKVPA